MVNEFISDYDTYSFLHENRIQISGWCDWTLEKIFGGFGKWDAVYFLKVAEQGYKYEQYMAFFPFYPWLLRILARTLHLVLQYFVSERNLLLACGWVLNTVFFVLAALSLYRLTLVLFGKKNLALVSTLLFCFNPASVFMASLYTESLFSCLQFTALCYLEEERSTLAVLLFSLGCATRSNGVISCGFVTHQIVKHFVSNEIDSLKSAARLFNLLNLRNAVKASFKLIIFNGIILAPFILFQLYGYVLYCIPQAEVTQDKGFSPWCDKLIPLPYSYIQDSYWNVGFLRYFELKQIPNFLLATPMILLSLCSVLICCCNRENLGIVKTLGLLRRRSMPDNMARYVHVQGINFRTCTSPVHLQSPFIYTIMGSTVVSWLGSSSPD